MAGDNGSKEPTRKTMTVVFNDGTDDLTFAWSPVIAFQAGRLGYSLESDAYLWQCACAFVAAGSPGLDRNPGQEEAGDAIAEWLGRVERFVDGDEKAPPTRRRREQSPASPG